MNPEQDRYRYERDEHGERGGQRDRFERGRSSGSGRGHDEGWRSIGRREDARRFGEERYGEDEEFGGRGRSGYGGRGGYDEAEGGYGGESRASGAGAYGDFRDDEPRRERGGWGSDERFQRGRGGRGEGSRGQGHGRGYGGERGGWESSSSSGRSSPGMAIYEVEAWTISGPYTGRGPKGYQRSDDQLREEVCQRLERHGDIDASEVEVKVSEGIVTLEGKVDDRQTKRLAEDCAEDVYGVRDVMNQLQVDRGFFANLFGGGRDGGERGDRQRSGSREGQDGGGRERSTRSGKSSESHA